MRVLDVQAEGEPGLPYIVLEWLHGKSWREQRETERVRDFDDELAILLQVADALTALHAAKIAHRDIKPDNIFLSRSIALDGDTVVTARLIDFDLVKVREGRAETDTRTAGLGTVDYMAPEQFEGGDVDVRVDVWALGVLLFEILTGRKPFEGRVDYEVAAKVIRDPVPSLDALSGRVDGRLLDLCRSLLEKSPAKRPMDGAARTRALLATLLQARGDRIDDRLPPEPDADRFESDVKKQFKTAMSMHWRAAGSSSSKDEPSASPPRTSETWPYWAATSVAAAVCAGALTWGAVRPTETVRPSRLRVESNVAGAEVFVGGARKGAISASNHAATVELDPQGALHNVELRCGTKILDSVSLDFAKGGKGVSLTIMKMGPTTNVSATGSALEAGEMTTAPARSAKAQRGAAQGQGEQAASSQPASADDLTPEDASGLPVPKRRTMSETSSTPFFKQLNASVPLDLAIVLDFYRRELGKLGWKEDASRAKVAAGAASLAFTTPTGPATLDLGRKNDETSVKLSTKNPEAARAAGILPKPGQAKVLFGNILPKEASLTFNNQPVKVAANAGTKAPDGPSLELTPGKYKYSIRLPGAPAQSDEVEIHADETWGLMIGPGGVLALQAY